MPKKPRDYKKEYRDFHGKPEQRKKRSNRNKARRKINAPKGRDVHHKDGNPNNNSRSNLTLRSPKNQRSEGARKRNAKAKRK